MRGKLAPLPDIYTSSGSPPGTMNPIWKQMATVVGIMLATATMLVALLSVGFTHDSRSVQAEGGPMCSVQMGMGMDNPEGWTSSSDQYGMDLSGRTWTAQEAFGSSLGVVNYHGEGKGTSWTTGVEENRSEAAGYSASKDKLEGLRNAGTCLGGNFIGSIVDMITGMTSMTVNFTNLIVTKSFDPNIICSDPENPEGSCINLLKVIGGSGSNKGVIGILTSSLYMPLIVIVVAINGLWLLKQWRRDRSVRTVLFGTAWTLGAAILGLAFLLNPSAIVKAPMTISSTVVGCVLDATNGGNCMSSNSGSSVGDIESSDICKADATSAGASQSLSLAVSGLTCQIWKAFVLEPYSQASFGRSFESLDLDNEDVAKAVTDAGFTKEDYGVSLQSTKAGEDMKNGTLELDGGDKIYNIALYQLYLKTDALVAGDSGNNPDTAYDERWFKVILPVAQNDSMWNQWSYSLGSATNKIATMTLAGFSALLGSVILIVVSVMALVYYFLSSILMVMAPLFLLVGVHPGQGRRLMLGWVEQIVSNMLKYIVSAIFLVITVILYGAVLGAIDSLMMGLMFVIILTIALFLYRSELLNMFGRANMGGEQMSNRLAQFAQNRAKGIGRHGMAIGTGALAGATAQGFELKNLNPKNASLKGTAKWIGTNIQNTAMGANDARKRDLRNRGGFVGNYYRQTERISNDNKNDLRDKGSQYLTQANEMSSDIAKRTNAIAEAKDKVAQTEQAFRVDKEAIEGIGEKVAQRNAIQESIRLELIANRAGGDAGRIQAINDFTRMEQLEDQISYGRAIGADVSGLQREYDATEARFNDYGATDQAWANNMAIAYGHMAYDGMVDTGIDYIDYEDVAHRAENLERYRGLHSAQVEEVNDLIAGLNEKESDQADLRAKGHSYQDQVRAWAPGKTVKGGAMREVEENAQFARSESYDLTPEMEATALDTDLSHINPASLTLPPLDTSETIADRVAPSATTEGTLPPVIDRSPEPGKNPYEGIVPGAEEATAGEATPADRTAPASRPMATAGESDARFQGDREPSAPETGTLPDRTQAEPGNMPDRTAEPAPATEPMAQPAPAGWSEIPGGPTMDTGKPEPLSDRTQPTAPSQPAPSASRPASEPRVEATDRPAPSQPKPELAPERKAEPAPDRKPEPKPAEPAPKSEPAPQPEPVKPAETKTGNNANSDPKVAAPADTGHKVKPGGFNVGRLKPNGSTLPTPGARPVGDMQSQVQNLSQRIRVPKQEIPNDRNKK